MRSDEAWSAAAAAIPKCPRRSRPQSESNRDESTTWLLSNARGTCPRPSKAGSLILTLDPGASLRTVSMPFP